MTIPRIGIDLGGTKIEGVLLGEDPCVPVLRERVATPRGRGYEAILDAIEALVRGLLAAAPEDVSGIGIAIPGTISRSHGRVKNANTTELNGEALGDDLRRRLNRSLVVENDANCFALAEALHGAGKGCRSVFGVILGTGVGGGIVLDGRIWGGAQGIAGEWGHTILDLDGPLCYCGRRGCVEMFLSGPGLEASYRTRTGHTLPAAEIWARGAEGADPHAAECVTTYKSLLGRALAQVINILDPEVVVLGGGVSRSPGLAEEAPERIRPWLFNDEVLTRIERHALGDSAGVLGAAWLSADNEPGR